MNVRIDRLILRCRGIERSTAQAAVREPVPALLRQLREGGGAAARGNVPSAGRFAFRQRPRRRRWPTPWPDGSPRRRK